MGAMKPAVCQLCGKNPGTLQFTQVQNGEVREVRVCPTCSEKQGFEFESESLTDFLFGLGMDKPSRQTADSKADAVCPACQMPFADYRKSSRLGCPQCYEAFSSQLAVPIYGMQRGRTRHNGKIPVRRPNRQDEIKTLKQSLRVAIDHQNYEEAARIRDQLHGYGVDRTAAGGVT